MDRDRPLNSIDEAQDAELQALFAQVEAPAPSADFVARTMRAVKLEPLPAGRRALRDPLASLVGWAAIIAGVALSSLMVVLANPAIASGSTRVISYAIAVGVWLTQFKDAGFAVLNVFAAIGFAVSRAAATSEGAAGLIVIAVIGGLSMSALRRLLISEEERHQWQELS